MTNAKQLTALATKSLVTVFLTCLAVIGLYTAYLQFTGNFHVVVPGRLYRAAQPTAEEIETWHAHYGIRTIVNLRGAHPQSDWYKIERTMAQALGIGLIDFPLSADRDLSGDQVNELLGILSRAKEPILIHCKNGADRSGLVSAFYVASVAKGSEFYAELQLTPLYGHMPLWFLSSYEMDRSYEKAEPTLGFPNS
jgi:protein tyrosine/serine phosphatase